jgi:hypothetical protein
VDSCLLTFDVRLVNFMANTTYPALRHVAVGNRIIAL